MTEIIDQVRELCQQNLSNNEICEKLNLTVWQLKKIMFSNHIQKPHKKKHVFDETSSKQAYILNALSVKPSVICEILNIGYQVYLRMVEAGKTSSADITEEDINTATRSIVARLGELGKPARK